MPPAPEIQTTTPDGPRLITEWRYDGQDYRAVVTEVRL